MADVVSNAFLNALNIRRKSMMSVTQCRKKMEELGKEAKGMHAEASRIDAEMDDLLARLTALSAERDRLAVRHEAVCDELETVEEEHDRLQRKERRKGRRLAQKKRVHDTVELDSLASESGEVLGIASRFSPEKASAGEQADKGRHVAA
jgi:predicted nuclease with TOPRIM domain